MTARSRACRQAAERVLGLALACAAAAIAATPLRADAAQSIVCGSKAGEREVCAADTSDGVTLVASLGTAACELGRTWGYDANGIWVRDGCSAEFSAGAAKTDAWFGKYAPTQGFKVADTEHGDLSIRVFTYLRYLNENGIDTSYTDSFGNTKTVDPRHDFELNKAQITLFGWLASPKFRYSLFVWSSNATAGLSAQVVVAGSLFYTINDHLTVGMGIGGGLPGTRSMEGIFPFWLMVDERQIADEFFRPSYTAGLIANGKIVEGLEYKTMLGNNLSQFGIDAGQLDNTIDTFSGALIWMPTTHEFGRGIGDFEGHDKLATRVAGHFTHSTETRQGQPTNDAFDNVQIRISDGNVIFSPGLFAPGLQIEQARYRMFAVDGGVKYHGFSLDAEYYSRYIDGFDTRGTGLLPFTDLHDTGYQVQASAMLRPRFLQVYAGFSKINGQYGDPHDARVGLNLFPWKNEALRWNFEYISLRHSPVGSITLPYQVGSNGDVFHTSFMVYF